MLTVRTDYVEKKTFTFDLEDHEAVGEWLENLQHFQEVGWKVTEGSPGVCVMERDRSELIINMNKIAMESGLVLATFDSLPKDNIIKSLQRIFVLSEGDFSKFKAQG